MARRQRPFALSYVQGGLATGTSDADIALNMVAPSEGAVIDRVILTVGSTAGVGAGTVTAAIHEKGGTRALSETSDSLDFDTAANGVLGTFSGNGVGATAAGTPIDLVLDFTSTITTEGNWICCVTWLP